jgi:hypothetical protein
MRVPVSEQFTEQSLHEHDVVLDGIFGFSFKGEVRAPFDTVLKVRAVYYSCLRGTHSAPRASTAAHCPL